MEEEVLPKLGLPVVEVVAVEEQPQQVVVPHLLQHLLFKAMLGEQADLALAVAVVVLVKMAMIIVVVMLEVVEMEQLPQ